MKEISKKEELRSRNLWKTPGGWRNRGKITWKEWNRPDKAVHESKLAELMIVGKFKTYFIDKFNGSEVWLTQFSKKNKVDKLIGVHKFN